ncbi:MAG: hypothetical protein GY941_04005 [Planctomycetes bacterium]|nr:hypothetical protein [Planctomycetota bacterium]
MKRRISIEELPMDIEVTKKEFKNVMGGYSIPLPKRGASGVGNPGSSTKGSKFFDVFTEVSLD